MEVKAKNVTRKGCSPIKVYCLPEERAAIEAMANASGHSASTYLRLVGMGYRIQGVIDAEQVREMVRVNGDLGRLGGS
ncbi:plasmid mobilization protein [Burkholderia cepacia]|nr:protein TraJ [Burkholderia cepacia]